MGRLKSEKRQSVPVCRQKKSSNVVHDAERALYGVYPDVGEIPGESRGGGTPRSTDSKA